jgi:hypothetical protein
MEKGRDLVLHVQRAVVESGGRAPLDVETQVGGVRGMMEARGGVKVM